jgi:two-component system chemotaxis response regulator CheB
MSEKLRVLIVDDTAFMRKAITNILESDPKIEVVDSAQNGLEALHKIRCLHPDVVTLDIDMPIMDGLSAIRHIMIETPIPIVVLSSLIQDGSITFEALRLGVVDFIPKPSGAISLNIDGARQQLIDRIKVAHLVKMENLRRVRLSPGENGKRKKEDSVGSQGPESIIILGTTLSGPNTTIRLVSQLSPALPASLVVVQEISPRILSSFVDRFDQYVPWKIEPARDGLSLKQGTCYVCSNEYSLTLHVNEENAVYVRLRDGIPQPLNLLYASAANIFHQKTIGVLLTGTGDDGAEGFARIQQEHGITLVEDTQCCVYPNLAHNAIQQGVVNHVLHESSLPKAIESLMARSSDPAGRFVEADDGIKDSFCFCDRDANQVE